jgi:hypothetical protein
MNETAGPRISDRHPQAGARLWQAVAVLLVTLLAAVLRFYRLPEVPPGLHFDEAFQGVTAQALLNGAPLQLFFEQDMGEEPIAIYLVASALGLAEQLLARQEPWIIRLASAIVGTLTIPLAWWLGRELGTSSAARTDGKSRLVGLQGPMMGLGSATILAILYWHLSFSRIGMEPILVPFFATLAFAALAHSLNTRQLASSSLSGLALGGSLYTYKAGYFVPAVAVLFVAFAAVVQRGFLHRHWRGLLLTALVALLVALPILVFFATHPANFLQRPASVALVGDETAPEGPWQALSSNLPHVLGMFFLEGDANPRSNLPGRPALDPFLALLFLVGLGWAIWAVLQGRVLLALPLVWLGVMVLPTLVTDYAPHFGRAIGATPALAFLCSLGGWALWQAAAKVGRRWAEVLAAALLTAGLLFSAGSTVRAYFSTWSKSPELFYAYDVGLAQVADYFDTLPGNEDVYLTPTSKEHFTLRFLVNRPFSSFDGRAGLVLPPAGRAATVVVLLQEDPVTLTALQRIRPDGKVDWTLNDAYGRPYAAAYHLPATGWTAALPDHPVEATFGGAARLLGYSVDAEGVAPGDELNLTLYWQALAPFDADLWSADQRSADYTVFTHLLGDTNPETGSPLWSGHDGQPDGGHFPTTDWQPGQLILDVHRLAIPANAPPGEYQIQAGFYLLATLARLPATDANGNPLPENAALLGTIRVGE